MSSTHSRKRFITHALGLLAAVGLAPRLLANSKSATPAAQADAAGALPFQIKTESRAVARTPENR